ncbi:phage tail protein [Pseudomonas saxonica]|uniref:Phage tail protein n=1 Tax=Pseudomonas saxonica TaxID=2600598 RepID=A0ABY3GH22_9PSED|nr:phage tail protein [Pseudomonas saxonica]TWR88700.1 phage tail protein [Pseudomonas saxonica]
MNSTYFHAKTLGFYLDEVHGPRTILVDDPAWKRPTKLVKNPEWPDRQMVAPQLEVPDESAYAPQVEASNPMCSLPPRNELVEITGAYHQELLQAQALGKVIQANAKGFPVAKAPPPLTKTELAVRERAWRDSVLLTTDALVVRHRDELEAERPASLSADQYRELQGFRLALRDWTEAASFPDSSKRPVEPDWLENGQVKAATA